MIAVTLAMPASLRLPRGVLAFAALLLAALPWSLANAQGYETRAKQAILIDVETGTVLFEKDADARMPPASMAKLMTMAVVFGALRDGSLKLDQEFVVSEAAWRQGGAPSRGTTSIVSRSSGIASYPTRYGRSLPTDTRSTSAPAPASACRARSTRSA